MILVFIIIKFNKGVIMEYNDIRYGMDFFEFILLRKYFISYLVKFC